MSILKTIEDWFKPKADKGDELLPNQPQEELKVPTASVEVLRQVTPVKLNSIPVEVDGIVPVWKMPSKQQIFKQSATGTITPQDFLDGDYKYSRITMWVTGIVAGQVSTGVYIGKKSDLSSGPMGSSVWGAQLPIDKPVVIEGVNTQLNFIQTQASITANGALSINYVAERWAD